MNGIHLEIDRLVIDAPQAVDQTALVAAIRRGLADALADPAARAGLATDRAVLRIDAVAGSEDASALGRAAGVAIIKALSA